ncbi:MAG: T9SS type A sorting domain-containing protein [Sphingobacteriaceae bacterium]|nr:T9SS type A sorting domain-containing protein [Sphingobacteriaceae bacterium]
MGNTIGDTLNWIEVSGTFTASGNESYLTLGNFLSDAATTKTVSNGSQTTDLNFYFIDDVSVIDFNLSASAGPDKNIFLGDSAFIGRPPEIGLECTWSSGTVSVGSGGGLWVKPTSPGTYSYVVTQNICGNIKTDTVNVNVSPSSINENTLFSNSIALYPQPAKDVVNISLNYFYEKSIEVRVVDVNARLVRSVELGVRSGLAQMQVSDLSEGVYILELRNSSGQVARKRLVIAR